MKIRQGFVSNSSSSSFTCIICGEEYSGMDAGLEDAEMFECCNGHVFCESHISEEDRFTAFKEYLLNDEYFPKKFKNKIKNMTAEELEDFLENEEVDEDDEFDRTDEEMRYGFPEKFCPICNFLNLDPKTTVEYLLKKYDITKEEIKQELKSKFNNYSDFTNFIKNEGEEKNED
jgi:hypothetical protein